MSSSSNGITPNTSSAATSNDPSSLATANEMLRRVQDINGRIAETIVNLERAGGEYPDVVSDHARALYWIQKADTRFKKDKYKRTIEAIDEALRYQDVLQCKTVEGLKKFRVEVIRLSLIS